MHLNPHNIATNASHIATQAKQDKDAKSREVLAIQLELDSWNKLDTTKKILAELVKIQQARLNSIMHNGATCDERALRAMSIEANTLTKVIETLTKTGTYAN